MGLLTPIPAYVVNVDYEDYAEGWTTNDPGLLTRQLARAEGYVDLMAAARPIAYPATDTLHSVAISGNPTGGDFGLSLTIKGVTYITSAIRFDSEAVSVAAALNAVPGFPGTVSGVGGPLPLLPVFLSYRGGLGARYVAPGSVVAPNLTGGSSPQATFTLSAQGGAVDKRFNVSDLGLWDLQALKRAVCAQTQYMQQMDPQLFTQAQYSSVKGPDFTTSGRLPVVAPLARREFALAGLTVGTARSRP